MIFSTKMENYNVFCQSDGGQEGQEVRLFTLLDESDKRITEHGSICHFWAGLTHTGKTNGPPPREPTTRSKSLDQSANSGQVSLTLVKLVGRCQGNQPLIPEVWSSVKKISRCCGHSGARTPESYAANLLAALGIWHQHAAADSCRLHDLQSAFRPALHSILLVLAAWNCGTQSSCSTSCLRSTRSSRRDGRRL
jgi:hypothetical protein